MIDVTKNISRLDGNISSLLFSILFYFYVKVDVGAAISSTDSSELSESLHYSYSGSLIFDLHDAALIKILFFY